MSKEKKQSWVTDGHGKIIGKDTTEYKDDGSSKTLHQDAHFDIIGGAQATKITGETYNKPDGTSKHYKK
ncbi:MAG: hypothetical protein ABIE07_07290 [Candidatus Zixiibacteriota bacterium]